jgi:lipopolysaccharide biosynthesis glycosyltransferase
MNIIPIVFTFDNNLLLPASVCISSLLRSAGEDTYYDIFILHSEKCDFSESVLAKYPLIYTNCNITFRTVEGEFNFAFEIRGITTTAYYRLLIPEIIPEYDKVLYSDVDVVFREDMSPYFNVDLTGYYMAGVDNASALRADVQKYIKDELGVDHKYGHFYSGNLVINSSLILKDNIIPQFRELAKKNFHQQDMDIINIACYGKIKALSPAFCLTNFLTEIIVKRKDEFLTYFSEDELNHALNKGIVHYNGPKPWKEWCVNFDIWWEAYRNSPVYDEQFYFDFFNGKQGELDKLPLLKRVKILLRYFVYGRKK